MPPTRGSSSRAVARTGGDAARRASARETPADKRATNKRRIDAARARFLASAANQRVLAALAKR